MAGVRIPRVLSIAGSDSGGGAGIQADLKAFAACGVHGMTAITALTAQNTVAVTAVHHVPAEIIEAQVEAVLADVGVDAVKIGMLGTVATTEAVVRLLGRLGPHIPVVLDPVMVSESGSVLLEPSARRALIEQLLGRVTVVTPNLPEAREIAGEPEGEPAHLVSVIHALGPAVVVLTGGHRDVPVDLFYDGSQLVELPGERHPDGRAHGSGCTHSSAMAAGLARGLTPLQSARWARRIAGEAVRNGLSEIGAGPGPVDVLDIRATRFTA